MHKCVHELYIRASKNLSIEESAKVKELLVEHKKTTFHDPEKPLTRANTIEHEIPTTGRPVRIPPRRVDLGQRYILEDEILKMEKEGEITKSTGPWCSLMVLVRKKDGTINFCVDYHKLNDELLHKHEVKPNSKSLREEPSDVKILCSLWYEFRVQDEILYRTGKETTDEWRLVISRDKRMEILSLLHDNNTAEHPNMSRMKLTICSRLYWLKEDPDNESNSNGR